MKNGLDETKKKSSLDTLKPYKTVILNGLDEVKKLPVPLYPSSAEREYARFVRSYMYLVWLAMKKYSGNIQKAYMALLEAKNQRDVEDDFFLIYLMIKKEFDKKEIDSKSRLEKIGKQVSSRVEKNWRGAVKSEFGIEPSRRYYQEFYKHDIDKWTADNIKFIDEYFPFYWEEIKRALFKNSEDGKENNAMKIALDKHISLKRGLEFHGRNEVSSFFAKETRETSEDANCYQYRWISCRDDRVRPCHRALDGKVFYWSDPPVMWHESSKGVIYTDKRCHPGEDYMCRCIAAPVFEKGIKIMVGD